MVPMYDRALAVISGGLVSTLLASVSVPRLPLVGMNLTGYLVLAVLFGFIWPVPSWRWGLWIVSLMLLMVGLSIALTGFGPLFLTKDLPAMLLFLLTACAGSATGAWFRNRKATSNRKLQS